MKNLSAFRMLIDNLLLFTRVVLVVLLLLYQPFAVFPLFLPTDIGVCCWGFIWFFCVLNSFSSYFGMFIIRNRVSVFHVFVAVQIVHLQMAYVHCAYNSSTRELHISWTKMNSKCDSIIILFHFRSCCWWCYCRCVDVVVVAGIAILHLAKQLFSSQSMVAVCACEPIVRLIKSKSCLLCLLTRLNITRKCKYLWSFLGCVCSAYCFSSMVLHCSSFRLFIYCLKSFSIYFSYSLHWNSLAFFGFWLFPIWISYQRVRF